VCKCSSISIFFLFSIKHFLPEQATVPNLLLQKTEESWDWMITTAELPHKCMLYAMTVTIWKAQKSENACLMVIGAETMLFASVRVVFWVLVDCNMFGSSAKTCTLFVLIWVFFIEFSCSTLQRTWFLCKGAYLISDTVLQFLKIYFKLCCLRVSGKTLLVILSFLKLWFCTS